MAARTLKVGILPAEEYRQRIMAIARGEYEPKAGEPKVWFESLRSLAQVLSEDNRALLALIEARKPRSLTELAEISGRERSNLSRTLKTLERYGVVSLKRPGKEVVPEVRATHFQVEFDLPSVKEEKPSHTVAAG